MIILMTCLFFCLSTAAQNSKLTIHKPARSLVYAEKLNRELSFLTDSICEGRATGTKGSVEAVSWISRKFRNAGLHKIGGSWTKTVIAENGDIGHNVMGLLPGAEEKHPEKYIIVGTHIDHLGIIQDKFYPGADASESGIVALTSIMEMASITRQIGKKYACNFLFVCFDCHENGLDGSKSLWNSIKDGSLIDPISGKTITKAKIQRMENLAQIGSSLAPLSSNREDYLIMLDGTQKRNMFKDAINMCNLSYSIGLELSFSYYGSENFTKVFYKISDQRVFIENKIPSVMFTSGITFNTNKTWDTVDSLNMEVLRKRIYLIYHWLLHII